LQGKQKIVGHFWRWYSKKIYQNIRMKMRQIISGGKIRENCPRLSFYQKASSKSRAKLS
jgi:hypothetical protein